MGDPNKPINKVHVAIVGSVSGLLLLIGVILWLDGTENNVDGECCSMAKEQCDRSLETCYCSCSPNNGWSSNDGAITCESDSVKRHQNDCSKVSSACKKCLNRQTQDFENEIQQKCKGSEWDCLECADGYVIDPYPEPIGEDVVHGAESCHNWKTETDNLGHRTWYTGVGRCVAKRHLVEDKQERKLALARRPELEAHDWSGFERMLQSSGDGFGTGCSSCDNYSRLCDDRGGQTFAGFIVFVLGWIVVCVGCCTVGKCCSDNKGIAVVPQQQFVMQAQPQMMMAQPQQMMMQQQVAGQPQQMMMQQQQQGTFVQQPVMAHAAQQPAMVMAHATVVQAQ